MSCKISLEELGELGKIKQNKVILPISLNDLDRIKYELRPECSEEYKKKMDFILKLLNIRKEKEENEKRIILEEKRRKEALIFCEYVGEEDLITLFEKSTMISKKRKNDEDDERETFRMKLENILLKRKCEEDLGNDKSSKKAKDNNNCHELELMSSSSGTSIIGMVSP